MLTVLAWFWRQPGGRCDYTAQHVNIWADMVQRNLAMPHRLACVTDHADGIRDGIEIIAPPREFENARIPTWRDDRPQCLRRLAMFRKDAGRIFGERFVCMDLDCVISGPLDPLFDRDDDFVMFRGTQPGRPYNGSMMMLRAGARPQVYEDFSIDGATRAGQTYFGSDQAWIAQCLGPGEATWGEEHGVLHWWEGSGVPVPDAARLLFFVGRTKPWDRLDLDRVSRHYRRDGKRSCLILGRGSEVWREAERALAKSRFDTTIALREPAKHWPGRLDAIADTDCDALRKATMLGASRLTFCGRTEVV